MNNNNDLRLELIYKKKGIISTSRIEESIWLNIDNNTIDYINEWRTPVFIKAIKKAVTLFNNDNYFDIDITLYYSPYYNNETRLALIHNDHNDAENGTYKLYTYPENSTTASINHMSKSALIKALTKIIQDQLIKYASNTKTA